MEATLIVSNVVANAALIGVAGFFTKRWMNRVDNTAIQTKSDLDEAAKTLAQNLKDTVKEHREEIKELSVDINGNLRGIYEQLRLANGRTAKLEGSIDSVKAVCAERHGK